MQREIICLETGLSEPTISAHFLGDGLVEPSALAMWQPIAASLPRLRPDPDDSAAGAMMSAAGLKPDKLASYLATLRQQFPHSKELKYAELELVIHQGEYGKARKQIETLLRANPYDWKARYLEGRIAFLEGDAKLAAKLFSQIRAELPGELAAQLALALALEKLGDSASAEPLYDRVSRADPSYVSAVFGLARCRLVSPTLTARDRKNAARALNRIPSASAHYVAAQLTIVGILISNLPNKASQPPTVEELKQASEIHSSLKVDDQRANLLADILLLKASQLVENGQYADSGGALLGCAVKSKDLKLGVERYLRRAARFATDPATFNALVDWANRARPRTFF